MTNKEIKIAYTEYASREELSAEDRVLAEAAIEAVGSAYAPYSNFHVGAAVRFNDGEIVKGSNQENAAYPSGICAERTALFYASASRPGAPMNAIAIAAAQNGELIPEPVTPCGACRQVMIQYQLKSGNQMEVMLIGANRIWKFASVDSLLPFIFDSI